MVILDTFMPIWGKEEEESDLLARNVWLLLLLMAIPPTAAIAIPMSLAVTVAALEKDKAIRECRHVQQQQQETSSIEGIRKAKSVNQRLRLRNCFRA